MGGCCCYNATRLPWCLIHGCWTAQALRRKFPTGFEEAVWYTCCCHLCCSICALSRELRYVQNLLSAGVDMKEEPLCHRCRGDSTQIVPPRGPIRQTMQAKRSPPTRRSTLSIPSVALRPYNGMYRGRSTR